MSKLSVQQPAAEVAHGIPHRHPSHGHNRCQNQQNVNKMNADGIGFHNEGTGLVAHGNEAEGLLQPAKQKTQNDSHHSAQQADEAAFVHEDSANVAIVRTQAAERLHIGLLVNHEHGQGTDDVEAGHQKDEGEKKIGNQLLHPHDTEHILLLFIAVVFSLQSMQVWQL